MRTITVDNKEVTIISTSYITHKGKNGPVWIYEILCIFCNKPKKSQAYNVKRGVSLMHTGCAVKSRYIETRNTVQKQREFIIARSERIYKQNAKNKKRIFSLTTAEINLLIFSDCFYCGQPPEQTYVNYTVLYNGIDRINSRMGYISGNCVTCCKTCNRAKMDLSENEFRVWLNRIALFNGYVKEITHAKKT